MATKRKVVPVAYFARMETSGYTFFGSGLTEDEACETVRKAWAAYRRANHAGYELGYSRGTMAGTNGNSVQALRDWYGIEVHPVVPGIGGAE